MIKHLPFLAGALVFGASLPLVVKAEANGGYTELILWAILIGISVFAGAIIFVFGLPVWFGRLIWIGRNISATHKPFRPAKSVVLLLLYLCLAVALCWNGALLVNGTSDEFLFWLLLVLDFWMFTVILYQRRNLLVWWRVPKPVLQQVPTQEPKKH
jgi:hypothetical protein